MITQRKTLDAWLNGHPAEADTNPEIPDRDNGHRKNAVSTIPGIAHRPNKVERHAYPEIVIRDDRLVHKGDKVEPHSRKRVCRYEIGREENALLVLLFGIGVLIFVVGACTGSLTVAHGFVGWVGTWVLGFALRAYCGTWVYRDTSDYVPEW